MLNKFKHLENGLTCIYVRTGKKSTDPYVEAYIDTRDFDLVDKSTTESWSLWKTGVTANVNGKFIKMSRVITSIYEDRQKIVINANRNPLDLRRENLVVGVQGAISRESFKVELMNVAQKLGPLPNEQDRNLFSIKENEENGSDGILKPSPSNLVIEKNISTNQISITVGGKKRILTSLSEQDAKFLVGIFNDLNVTIG